MKGAILIIECSFHPGCFVRLGATWRRGVWVIYGLERGPAAL